jgi:hypothetical protein
MDHLFQGKSCICGKEKIRRLRIGCVDLYKYTDIMAEKDIYFRES